MSRSGTTTRDRTRGSRRPADPRSPADRRRAADRSAGGRAADRDAVDRGAADRGAADRGVAGRGASGRRGSASQPLPSRRPGARVTRLPRRRTGLRRRHLRLAVTVLVVTGVAWALLAGPVLAVRTVQVDGAGILPAELVRKAAGIEVGLPLLRVDVGAAEKRVARLPQVSSVAVARDWPSSVVITVVERVPVAIVGDPAHRSLIDARGVLFDSVTGQAPAGVVPLDVAHPGPGDPATMAGLAAVGALPAGVRGTVVRAAAASAEDVSLQLTDGTVVRWGDAGRSTAKAAALAGLLQQFAAGALQPAKTIDVSTPGAVVLR